MGCPKKKDRRLLRSFSSLTSLNSGGSVGVEADLPIKQPTPGIVPLRHCPARSTDNFRAFLTNTPASLTTLVQHLIVLWAEIEASMSPRRHAGSFIFFQGLGTGQ